MTKIDIHRYEKRIENALRRIKNGDLLEINKRTLLEFYEYLDAEGLSRGRIAKYLFHLLKINGWLNLPFEQATKNDIVKLVRTIENQNYTPNTKHDYKIVIKRFYKWLRSTEECPLEVKWIKCTVKESDVRLPEELLTAEEINKLINAATHPRNKAMIALLYESGCRVGELLSLQRKNIVFDEFGALVTLEGKTGMRKIRVMSSVPYLSTWIENHPWKEKPDFPLWTSISNHNQRTPILYTHFKKMLVDMAKKAGITKRVNPHSFRHSRASKMANHLTDAQMNNYFGWVQGSDMPATYVHLSGRDMDNAIFKMNGMKTEKLEQSEDFRPKICHHCEKPNPSAGKLCLRCGAILDVETIMKIDDKWKNMNSVMVELLKDPKVFDLLMDKMKQMNVNSMHTDHSLY
ncbi:MAG: tyrosine-type recombinase/integrase [Candidatus Thermoplasmatota archaeon]|nr:tyrosine-type recombinase/integrase [Candidatus Thermoplasmatota archaeon]